MIAKPSQRDKAARRVHLVDTTLRDGEQTPGVSFSLTEKLAIVSALSRLGASELEVGIPAMGRQSRQEIRAIARAGLSSRLTVWCRATEQDIDAARQCQTEGIHLSLPVSEIQLEAMGKDLSWALEQLESAVLLARRDFGYVSVGAQDASRTDAETLRRFTTAVSRVGANRLRLADTVGIWNPMQTFETFTSLLAAADGIELAFHGHNDLGMATANTLAAFAAGAGWADVTVTGLGERAGNAPLEEVAVAAGVSADLDTGIDTTSLPELCKMVSLISGRAIHPAKPIVGDNAFVHESGIHVRALLADRRAYEPFDPARVGRGESRFVVGSHSGTAGLRFAMEELGVQLDDDQARALLAQVRRLARQVKQPLAGAELLDLYRQLPAS